MWQSLRRAAVFGLGCWVIADSLLTRGDSWPSVAVGAIMVGALPLDDYLHWRRRPPPS